MSRSGRNQGLLVSLAESLEVYTEYPGLRLSRPSAPVATPLEAENVTIALERTRSNRFNAKSHVFRKRPSTSPTSPQEATDTLEELIRLQGFSAAQAQRLIAAGANVNFSREKSKSLVKKVRSKDQETVRSNVLDVAVQSGDANLVNVLAAHADQENRDNALGLAIQQYDLDIVRVLMIHHADPNHYDAQIQNAIRNNQTDLAHALLSGSVHLIKDNATRCLTDAVRCGDLRTLQLLLWHKADVNSDNGSALSVAARNRRPDLVAALCLAKSPPNTSYLAKTILTVHSIYPSFTSSDLKSVEILLAAGATGPEISQVLQDAVSRGQRDLIQLLIKYYDFDAETSLQVFKTAMLQGDIQSLECLTGMNVDISNADSLLSFASTIRPNVMLSTRYTIVELLLQFQPSKDALSKAILDASKYSEADTIKLLLETDARGINIDDALYYAVQNFCRGETTHLRIIDLLVSHGADVNVRDGESLTTAASSFSQEALQVLLKGSPTLPNLNAVFICCLKFQDVDLRFNMISQVIKAGASGSPVNCALLDVLGSSSDECRLRKLYLDLATADINFNNGRCITNVIESGPLDVLSELLEYGPNEESLSTALSHAICLSDRRKRLGACQIICSGQKKPSEEVLSNCVVSIIQEQSSESELLSILLKAGASNDHAEGASIKAAIGKQDRIILSQLLRYNTSSETLTRALEQAIQMHPSIKLPFCQMLLDKIAEPNTSAIGNLLEHTFDASPDLNLLKVFLGYGVSINSHSLPAISKAVTLGNALALKCLISADASNEVIQKGWEQAWRSDGSTLHLLKILGKTGSRKAAIDFDPYLIRAVRRSPSSIELIEFLIRQGANVSHDHNRSLIEAALRIDPDLLGTLLKHVRSRADVSAVFGAVIFATSPSVWDVDKGVDVVSLLLQHGASGEVLNRSLLLCTQRYHTHRSAQQIIDLLLAHQACSDYLNGEAFTAAVRSGDATLVEKLFTSVNEEQTVNRALSNIFESFTNETIIIELLQKFSTHFEGMIDLNKQHNQSQPVMFQALRQFPQSTLLLETMLAKGASLSQTTMTEVSSDKPQELASTLLWALANVAAGVREDVVIFLINNGADVNFETNVTRTTPLLMACRRGRLRVVIALLRKGALLTIRDNSGRSPLCYASADGGLPTVRTLVEDFGAPRNDYSLHEAVLCYRTDVVQYLIGAGHDPNLTSSLHDMWSPIELLIRQEPPKDHISELIELFKSLADAGANVTYQYQGKSPLFTALDMPHAIDVTIALMSAFMGRHINESFNLFRSNGFVYSAIAYVEENKQPRDPAKRTSLLRLLASYNCKDIFYHETGPQPPGYRGAPQFLIEKENAYRSRSEQIAQEEEDSERRRRQQTEDHRHMLRLQQESHEESIRRETESEENSRWQSSLTHQQKVNQDRERSNLQLEFRRTEELQNTEFLQSRRDAEIKHERDQNRLRNETSQETNRLQLDFNQEAARIEQSTISARRQADAEMHDRARRARSEQQANEKLSHDRTMKQIAAQQRMLEHQKQINSTQQKALKWDDIDP